MDNKSASDKTDQLLSFYTHEILFALIPIFLLLPIFHGSLSLFEVIHQQINDQRYEITNSLV